MKKILGIIALATLSAASFTACNNRPPFEQLKATVDSANVAVHRQPLPMTDSCAIKYDEITNTVKYLYYSQDSIDASRIDPVIEDMKTQFITSIIANDPSMTRELLAAKANVMLEMCGSHNTKFELMVENSDFSKFYKELSGNN